jgi:hypothetical protein
MKKYTSIVIFAIFYQSLLAQGTPSKNFIYRIAYTGDSSLLIEKYEINLKTKKIYYITPIMNYLDIKGVKYKTKQKTSKERWMKISNFLNRIDFVHLDSLKQAEIKGPRYVLELLNENELKGEFVISKDEEPNDLKRLFVMIKN